MIKNIGLFEPLNEALIRRYLNDEILDCLDKLQVYDQVASTNDEVLNDRPQKRGQFNVCIANQQTAGRGRNGKVWQSPPDANIYISIGVALDSNLVKKLNGVSLACGVALSRLLESLDVKVGLKWPNDILVENKKLAGILVETRIQSDQIYIVVGVGLNVKMPEQYANDIDQPQIDQKWIDQPCIDQPWIDLSQLLTDNASLQNRNQLAAALIMSLIRCLKQFTASGFDSFVNDWQRFDILTGRKVIIKSDSGEVDAKVLGFNRDYSLRAEVNQQEKIFYAADIKLRIVDKC